MARAHHTRVRTEGTGAGDSAAALCQYTPGTAVTTAAADNVEDAIKLNDAAIVAGALTADELAAINGAAAPAAGNVFATMADLPADELTADELAAINGAAAPAAGNVFATMADVPAAAGNLTLYKATITLAEVTALGAVLSGEIAFDGSPTLPVGGIVTQAGYRVASGYDDGGVSLSSIVASAVAGAVDLSTGKDIYLYGSGISDPSTGLEYVVNSTGAAVDLKVKITADVNLDTLTAGGDLTVYVVVSD